MKKVTYSQLCLPARLNTILIAYFFLLKVSLVVALSIDVPPGGKHGIKQLTEIKSDQYGGKGLFAITSVNSGEEVLSVPSSSLICSRTSNERDRSSIVNKIAQSVCPIPGKEQDIWYLSTTLAVWRLCKTETQQKTLLGASVAQDVAYLPWESAHWQLPMLWSDKVLNEALEHCCKENNNASAVVSVCKEARERIENLSNLATTLSQHIEPCLAEICNDDSMNVDKITKEEKSNISNACHEAVSFIVSRTLSLPKSGRVALIPILDLANQSDNPNAEFDDDESDESPARLVAIREISKGDEITISYGVDHAGEDKSPAIFFAGYGFVPEKLATTTVEGMALRQVSLYGQALARSTT